MLDSWVSSPPSKVELLPPIVVAPVEIGIPLSFNIIEILTIVFEVKIILVH